MSVATINEDIAKKEKDLEAKISKIEKMQKSLEESQKDSIAGLGGGGPTYNYPIAGGYQSSLENNTMAAFGKRHVKDLLDINVADRKYSHVDNRYKSVVMGLKESIDIARFTAQIFHGAPLDRGGRDEKSDIPSNVSNILDTQYGREVLTPQLRAFGTGVSGGGAEWIPTAVSSAFIEEFELEKRVATIMREMPMPTNPYKLTVQNNVTTARIATENTAMTDANFGTANITFDATKLGEFYRMPEELNEDSAPAILSIARGEVVEAQVRARETVILNGDDSGTHMDNDTDGGAADLAQKLAKGLRKLAIANSANGAVVTFSSAVTKAKLDEMRTAMGKFGVNVRDLIYIFSPTTYNQAVNLDEVTTVEKFGPQATILSGALAAFRGIPVVISEFVREDVAATGVNTSAGPNDKGLVYLCNLRRFWVGVRRPIRLRVMMDLPDQDRWLLSSYSRIDFQGHAQSATEVSSVVGIDVTI